MSQESHIPPLAPPVPAMPLGYAYEANQRPGIITTIGVISIVVASISLMGSGLSGLYGFGLFVASKMSSAFSASGYVNISTTNPGYETGLTEPNRSVVVQTVGDQLSLVPQQRAQFDELLAQHGETIFQFGAEAVTPQAVRTRISSSGQLPVEGPEQAVVHYFVTGWGTVEIHADRAIFEPVDDDPVTVFAGGVMSDEQVADLVIEEIKSMAEPTKAQIEAIRQWVATSTQTQVDPRDPAASVLYAEMLPNDNLSVAFADGTTILWDKRGTLLSTQFSTTTTGLPFQINASAASLVMVEALLSFGLAIYLLVIGIFTLRQSLRGRQLHLIYAWLKFPLALAFAGAWAWVISSMGNGIGSGAWGVVVFVSIVAALSCVYPLGLLIALNRPAVKQYYGVS